MRSFRASDIGIVKPAHAVVVASGGAPPTVKRLAAAHVKTRTEGAPGFYRDGNRMAPYNLLMHLPVLARTLKSTGVPPYYLPWGSAKDFPAGKRAGGLSAHFSGLHTTTWRYRQGGYDNPGSNAARGDRFRAGVSAAAGRAPHRVAVGVRRPGHHREPAAGRVTARGARPENIRRAATSSPAGRTRGTRAGGS